MEHLAVACAVFLRAGHELDLGFYTDAKVGGVTRLGTLNPSESAQRREQLANMRLVFDRAPTHELVRASSPGLAAADQVIEDLREGRMPEDLGEDALEILLDLDEVALYGYRTRFNPAPRRRGRFLIACVEQEPNPASRVTLSDRRDALGLPTVVLDWRLGEIERSTLRRTLRILAAECGRTGIGRVREIDDDIPALSTFQRRGPGRIPGWPVGMRGSYHHMGTTRMAADPRRGVVDANCRVHGVANLYVAGSSVFPTCGHANPTLTIVALATRLAGHLRSRLA